MSEMAEDFKVLKELKQKRHQEWFDKNMEILNHSEHLHAFKETVCLFRDKDRPKADFYPHTGRWKSNNKMYRGGAKAFLVWYENQGDVK